jgi:hypothetical protein
MADAISQGSRWVWKTSGMGGPTGWWTGDTSTRPDDAPPSSDPALLWSHIVEETPDPLSPYWVTETQAAKLLRRVESAGDRADSTLLDALRRMVGH